MIMGTISFAENPLAYMSVLEILEYFESRNIQKSIKSVYYAIKKRKMGEPKMIPGRFNNSRKFVLGVPKSDVEKYADKILEEYVFDYGESEYIPAMKAYIELVNHGFEYGYPHFANKMITTGKKTNVQRKKQFRVITIMKISEFQDFMDKLNNKKE